MQRCQLTALCENTLAYSCRSTFRLDIDWCWHRDFLFQCCRSLNYLSWLSGQWLVRPQYLIEWSRQKASRRRIIVAGMDVFVAPISIKKGMGILLTKAVPLKCPCWSVIKITPPDACFSFPFAIGAGKCVEFLILFNKVSAPYQSALMAKRGYKRYLIPKALFPGSRYRGLSDWLAFL